MNKFWNQKKVLITGYEGFLGSNLTKKLVELNADIIGLDIKVNRRQTILCERDYRRIKVIKGSVENLDLLRRILEKHNIEIVFHLAAEAIVNKCAEDPVPAFNTNIQGSWNVLEACRTCAHKPGSIVMASSDKAYGSCRSLPYKETTPLAGIHPYDASKSCSDLLAQTYAHTYNLPVVITRCGNIYGPGDFNFSRLIPDALRCIKNQTELLVRSDGKFIRDYVYIDDIVAGYMLLARNLEFSGLAGEAFNFSANCPVSVIELLKKISKVCLKYGKLKYRVLNQAHYEIKKQFLSCAKARRLFKWRAKCSLEDGLRKTARWYLQNPQI
jgi:CDP-glucose 4,6-dehydratase